MRHDIINNKDVSTVYILQLNWNGWQDTIECLESVFRNSYDNYRVILCDNGSTDGSLDRIKQWAEGRLSVWTPPENPLRHLSHAPVVKPIAYREYSRSEAEAGGTPSDADAKLILIQTGANLGFAGGNNVGLRYALARGDFEYVWLLNTDTAIAPDALHHLVAKAASDKAIGMCGSTLLFYHHPYTVQTLGGGYYNAWLGLTAHIGEYQSFSQHAKNILRKPLDYVMGASMLVTRRCLECVGMMNEVYFLYFEELDWAMRAKGQFQLGYAPDSIVFHKSGQSVGNTLDEWSPTSVFYSIRSRLKFTQKFYPQFLPLVYGRLCLSLVNQWRKGKHAQARAIWDAMSGKNR